MPQHASIYVLGGHKLSLAYIEKLLKARDEKIISFDQLYFIDPNTACAVTAKKISGIHFIQKSYVNALSDLLPCLGPADLLIPDHTAPHVLFQLFIDLLQKEGKKVEVLPFTEGLETPYQKNFDSGVCAVSYATWMCPVDCDEPAICPHTKSTRTWDFVKRFSEFKPQAASLHTFHAQQLAYGVAQIPAIQIKNEWLKLQSTIRNNSRHRFIVATFSHCHGIVGIAQCV